MADTDKIMGAVGKAASGIRGAIKDGSDDIDGRLRQIVEGLADLTRAVETLNATVRDRVPPLSDPVS